MLQNISQKSIKKNTIFNFLLSFASVLFPFITTPYISRVLNIEDIGIINQGSILSSLFINLISLGLTGYGAREIARVRNNKKKLNEVFFSVITLHFATFIVGAFFYLEFIVLFVEEQKLKQIYFIYFFLLASNPFMIEWFYTGLEEFRYISIRSILVKILMFILLFIFVRTDKNFFNYAILLVAAQSLNSIFNIIHARKYISFKFLKFNFKSALFGSRYFYFQTIVAICYQNINQLVLGSNDKVQLALYARATMLTSVISSFVNPIMNAVKPRLEHIISNEKNQYEAYINKCFSCVMLILVPLCFGMAALSSNIMLLFGGQQFSLGGSALKIAAFSALISNLSVFFNNIISIPAGFEKNTLFGNISVAIFSLALNPFLILRFGANGAAVTMLFAEFSGLIVQLIFIKKEQLYLKFINLKIIKYFASSMLMYISILFLAKLINKLLLSIVFSVIAGILIYSITYLLFAFLSKDKDDILVNILRKFIQGENK